MFPNLSKLDIGVKRKKPDSFDDPNDLNLQPGIRELYKQLIETILQDFKTPLTELLVADPCGVDSVISRQSRVRNDSMRASAMFNNSLFVRQMISEYGQTLTTRINEQIAKELADFYLVTVEQMGAKEKSVREEIFMERFKTESADRILYAFATDAYTSLKNDGISVGPGKEIQIELSFERAHEETYAGRSPYAHMDEYTYGSKDASSSFGASFCAQKIKQHNFATNTDAYDILILDCGTILYTGVPVITYEMMEAVAVKLQKDKLFAPCKDKAVIVREIGEALNLSTQHVLKNYNDDALARMGIKTMQVQARTWLQAHMRTFHRSPVYSDMVWREENQPSDPWALAVWKSIKRGLTNAPRETFQMRCFSRLGVRDIDEREIPGFLFRRFTLPGGENVRVGIRTTLGV